MKKILLALCTLVALFSCDNEVDINAEYQDLSIIYGMLNPKLDSNYVRVQRGYLGTEPASSSVGQSDSLYYDTADIDVYIREYAKDATTFDKEAPLIYDNSILLDSGLYTGDGYYLFRVPSAMDILNTKEYEVAVIRKDGSEASARTGIVGDIDILIPRATVTAKVYNGLIEFRVRQDLTGNSPDATVKMTAYQPIIQFHYKEVDLNTRIEQFKTATITLPLVESIFDNINLTFTGTELNQALAERLEKNPNVIRFFQSLDVEIYGASEELMTFIELNKPSTGINQNRPDYSQVINGSGILSSRTFSKRVGVSLQTQLYNRLLVSQTTCDLNFARFEAGNINGDTCWCVNNEKICF
tara:strand:- start:7881 stop:8948 length:1068 start_codon:yes stop_codon:yes gene_type:complete